MPGSDCRLVNSAFNHMQECNGFELIVTVKKNVVEKFFIFSQDVKNHLLNRLKLLHLVHTSKTRKFGSLKKLEHFEFHSIETETSEHYHLLLKKSFFEVDSTSYDFNVRMLIMQLSGSC